jgi:glycosyltransferase involved in cell wall biosynthesis
VIDELSIVIPTLNEASCIGDLLKSLLLQTYIGKLQVVVVDGHSTDNTAAVIRSFARSIPDLLLITAKCDIGHQRNVGAKHSKYRYFLMLTFCFHLKCWNS